MKTLNAIIIVFGIVALVAIVLMLAEIIPLLYYQLNQEQFRDEKVLTINNFKATPNGLVLLVKSNSSIVNVTTQSKEYHFLQIGIIPVPFKVLKATNVQQYIVLVPYEFRPNGEFYLELFSQDGHWYSMSPYFRDTVDLTNENWTRLWDWPINQPIAVRDVFTQ